MISCIEANANFNAHVAEVNRIREEKRVKCIENTKTWCNTTLSQMIAESSAKGNRRLSLRFSSEGCYIEDGSYYYVEDGYVYYERNEILNVSTMIRMLEDHGFNIKSTTVTIRTRSNGAYKGTEYTIEWA